MSKKIKVTFNLENKKGEKKNVSFYMDESTYLLLNNEVISEYDKNRYLYDEYYSYLKEQKNKRRIKIFNNIENFKEVDESENLSNSVVNKKNHLLLYLKGLSIKQQEVIKKIVLENKSITQASKELHVSKQSVSLTYKRAINNLRKIVSK